MKTITAVGFRPQFIKSLQDIGQCGVGKSFGHFR